LTGQKQRWSVGCHVREEGCHIREGGWEYVSGTDKARIGWKRRRSAPKSYTPSVFRTVPGHELVEEPVGTPPREAAGRVGGRVAPAASWARPRSKRKPVRSPGRGSRAGLEKRKLFQSERPKSKKSNHARGYIATVWYVIRTNQRHFWPNSFDHVRCAWTRFSASL